jgi:mannose-1-phosphate guanylyltransferase
MIEFLRENRINDIIVACGHLGNKIQNEIGDGRKYGVKITYSFEKKALGTAGAIINAQRYLDSKPFLVVNGDILTKFNLQDFINFHNPEKYLASIALHITGKPKGYGSVWIQGEKIIQFVKHDSGNQTPLVDAGIYILNPSIVEQIQANKYDNLENLFVHLAKNRKVSGFAFEGKWFEVSTPVNYGRAIKEW